VDPQTHVVESENKLLSLNFDVTMYVVKRTRKEKKDFGRQACKASKPDKQTERGQVACICSRCVQSLAQKGSRETDGLAHHSCSTSANDLECSHYQD